MARHLPEGIELLADPTRRRIVALIAGTVSRPADIAAIVGLGRPAVSRQLRLLTKAGLLRWTWSRLDLRCRIYRIDPAWEGPIIVWLAGVDLRNVRPQFLPTWSPPARPRPLHRLQGEIKVDRDRSW
jgi:DNA-binding transcriptional ArsR family regulator